MPERTCEIDGCSKAHRAKGLCSTHYNAANGYPRPVRRYEERTCDACGESFTCATDNATAVCYPGNNDADRDCRWFTRADAVHATSIQHGDCQECSRPFVTRAALTLPPTCGRHVCTRARRQRLAAHTTGAGRVWKQGRCRNCGDTYVTQYRSPGFCSRTCARRENKYLRRAAGRVGHPVHRREVFERDGWRCQLCCKPVPMEYRDPHIGRRYLSQRLPDLAPVLDHIVPLGGGNHGKHEPANVQCAHSICNAMKSDKLYDDQAEQLRLVG